MSTQPACSKSSVRLDSICEIMPGGRHKLSGKNFIDEGGFPAYGAGGHNGNLPSYEFDQPGIVLSAIGARCGKCFQPSGKWSSLANTSVFFPDRSRVDIRFLWYQLNDEASWHRSGTAQPYIKPSDIKGRLVQLPPLAEQKRIAAILDAADGLRAKRREALAQLDTLLQSTFLDMFGDPVTNPRGLPRVTMADLGAVTQYGTSLRANERGQGIPILRMNNITYEGGLDLGKLKWVEVPTEDLPKYTTRRGDLLFNRTNSPELVGKTTVWDRDEVFAIAGYLVRVRFDPDLAHPHYISGFLNSRYGKRLLASRAKPSNNMSNFSAGMFRGIPVLQPTIEEQAKFAAVVEAVQLQRLKHRTHLNELDTLFASLQQRAFRGDL